LRPEWDGSVAGLAGLGRQAPMLGGSVAVLLISLAGLPPFLGFWSKLIVFGTAISIAHQNLGSAPQVTWTLGSAVSLGLLGSVVSLAYYGSILRSLFMDTAPELPIAQGALEKEPAPELASATGEGSGPAPRRTGSAATVVMLLALLVTSAGVATVVLGSSALFELFATH